MVGTGLRSIAAIGLAAGVCATATAAGQGPVGGISHQAAFAGALARPFVAGPYVQVSRPELSRARRGPTRSRAISAFPGVSPNFAGQAGVISGVYPPDPTGDVGPTRYVQAVNLAYEIWDKSGAVTQAAGLLRALWTGYVGTNPSNHCADRNDGDPLVQYDQLADRWVISQFSIPNPTTTGGPSFRCVAVSRTSDPAGLYWLYDFRLPFSLNGEPKLGVWPDGYYFSFNAFDGSTPTYEGVAAMAVDRASMLNGSPAAAVTFQTAPVYFGFLPSDLQGPTTPASGTPNFYFGLDEDANGNTTNKLDIFKFHVDWTTPASSTFTGPTQLATNAFTPVCAGVSTGECVPEPGSNLVAGHGYSLMYPAPYRVIGGHDSVVLEHSVVTGSTSGIQWYELRGLAANSPSIFQQGVYAPPDALWRWLGSAAMDQSGDVALGYSASSATTNPEIALTGRLGTDSPGTMGQGESVVHAGTGHETASAPGTRRWGDYSTMSVDPVDDCTFWYTNEDYDTSGTSTWRTQIAAFKFPSCGVPTVADITQLGARWTRAGVRVTWTTASEARTAGFNLWRSTGRGWRKVNRRLILASMAGRPSGSTYAYVDRTARRRDLAEYRLQLVSVTGKRTWYGVGVAATR